MKFVLGRWLKARPKPARQSQNVTDGLPKTLSFAWYEGCGLIFSIGSYVLDMFLDVGVAWEHYDDGKMWYFGLTVAFVVIASLVMTCFSLRWYIMDSKEPNPPKVSPRQWALRIVLHLLQMGPILRYADSLRYGVLYRKEADKNASKAKMYFKRMTFEDADAGLLRLFEAFMEAAPQLLLQTYIMAQPDYDQGTDTLWFQFASSVMSLLSLSWALVSQQRSQRFSQAKSKNPTWSSTSVQYCWYLLVTYARMLSLGLFLSLFPVAAAIVCVCRFVIMTTWLQTMKSNFCDTGFEEILYKCVLGAIFTFCYVNPVNTPTRWRYLFYYLYTFTENSILISMWYVAVGPTASYRLPAIMSVYASFFIGIVFMVVYYLYFHPSGKIQVFGWWPLRPKTLTENYEIYDCSTPAITHTSLPREIEISPAESENIDDTPEIQDSSTLAITHSSSLPIDIEISPAESENIDNTCEKKAVCANTE